MQRIIDKSGRIIHSFNNLRGIRTYINQDCKPERVTIQKTDDGEGILIIEFVDQSFFSTRFASFKVLCRTLRYWRGLYGTPLFTFRNTEIVDIEKVEFHNGYLKKED